ncbi:MAG TPA: hypothetical protein VNI83_02160 [Vicinamibacterales bacterium]|nr:hypothetical protein [Vicinamibacterales bacterium]
MPREVIQVVGVPNTPDAGRAPIRYDLKEGIFEFQHDVVIRARKGASCTVEGNAGSGDHPDLATHDAMGLVTETELDAHEVATDPHTIYQRESEKGLANGYASLDTSAKVPDAQIPDSIARVSQLPDLPGHVAASDPHAGYQLESERNAPNGYAGLDANARLTLARLPLADTDGKLLVRRSGSMAYDTLQDSDIPASIARDSEVTSALSTHEGQTDPHPNYRLESTLLTDADIASANKDGLANVPSLRTLGTGAQQAAPGNHTHGGGGGGSPLDAWPVGSVFIAVVSTSPATLLGGGTWVRIGQGRMLVGQDDADADFDVAEETGGAKTHTHAGHADHVVTQPSAHTQVINHTHPVDDPGHTHLTQRYPSASGSLSGFTIDTSMSGTLADNTLPTKAATTGITTQNPVGGVSSISHSGTAVDAHSAHDSPSHLPPYLVVYMWKRTA